ncbi:MAG: hypothetical protein EOO51_01230 [Flavobacterium sp.]|nr:MAG: hypothetical protein EOO51_01230 [Flavobacterium sp.]
MDNQSNAPFVIDLNSEITEMLSAEDKPVSAKPLYKTEQMQVLLISLRENGELKRHTAPGPITVHVLKGAVTFHTDNSESSLKPGSLLTLEKEIPHSVFATEDSCIMVTKSL